MAVKAAVQRTLRPKVSGVEFAVPFRTKVDLTYEALRKSILMGRLRPGERLDQKWLADSFNVSRMPLRQALLRLEADGLIENRPHRSAIVSPLAISDIRDIYAMRRAMEGMLAEAGAARCGPACIAKMAAHIKAQQAAVAAGDIENFVEHDRAFHRELYLTSGHVKACDMMERIRDLSDRYVRFYADYKKGAARSIEEHKDILRSCAQKRAKDVRRLIEQHIARGQLILSKLIQDGELARSQPAHAKFDHRKPNNKRLAL